ncbi:hypothetical protein NMY22_g18011 [Coprinellus aureogranulatus]|nr:hypothetical protein NMY22_g18011 [Coprinellus aureogranulatus]
MLGTSSTQSPSLKTSKNCIVPVAKEEWELSLSMSQAGRFTSPAPVLPLGISGFTAVAPTSKHVAICAVLHRWQHFASHLDRQGETFSQVTMEMHFLEEIVVGEQHTNELDPQNFKPEGNNLLASDESALCELPDTEKPIGVTLYNDGDVSLYPYLLYFDLNDLTIVPWFIMPTDADEQKVEPPLKCGSAFRIGYGDSVALPRSFPFDKGRTRIGLFQLFLSTSPVNFGSLTRETSPFEPPGDDSTEEIDWENIRWGAQSVIVIHQPKSASATHSQGASVTSPVNFDPLTRETTPLGTPGDDSNEEIDRENVQWGAKKSNCYTSSQGRFSNKQPGRFIDEQQAQKSQNLILFERPGILDSHMEESHPSSNRPTLLGLHTSTPHHQL